MDLGDIGEFGLIDRIIGRYGDAAARDIVMPPGDDAAVWDSAGGYVVTTLDTLAEDTHWRRDTMSFEDVGWRAVATSVSDIAAMGAEPGYLLIAVQVGPGATLDDMDGFADGVAAACRSHGVRVAGGDITSSRGTTFTTTGFGVAHSNGSGAPALLTRRGARPGDLVAVSGAPGASAAGYALIADGRAAEDGAAPLVAAHRRPRARIDLGRAAVEAGARCAIDISDGLLQDLGHIARASDAGIEVDSEAAPLHPASVALLGADRALALALGGGEDYELALTAPAAAIETLTADGFDLTVIGRVVAEHPGEVVALDADGQAVTPSNRGWDHLRRARP